jgi:hypothetical protein
MSFFFPEIGNWGQNWSCQGVGTSGKEGRMWGEGVGGRIWCKYCIHMNIYGKMKPVETIPGIGAGEIEENDGGGESNYDLF